MRDKTTKLHNLAVTLALEVKFNYVKEFDAEMDEGTIDYFTEEFRKALIHLKSLEK
jgi:hypothetical protein